MTTLEGKKELVADLLYALGAIQIDTEVGFRLKLHERLPSAPLSPIYLNLRTPDHSKNPGPLTPEIMQLIAELMDEMSLGLGKECFTGIPEAGEPFADYFEKIVGASRLRLQKVEKNGKRWIDDHFTGDFEPGDRCIIIDDLITQADSKLEAIRALTHSTLQISGVLVVVDRMQGGRQQLMAAGHRLFAIFTLHELLSHYARKGYIDQSQAETVLKYIAVNQA